MTTTRPPGRLEHKAAPAMLEPSPARAVSPPEPGSGITAVDDATGIVEALVAVTGVKDEVNDVIESGALTKSLRRQTPRMCLGHDWSRVIGRTVSAVELLPGDSRLPAVAPDGTPWPAAAGALHVRAKFLLGTKDGREAYEVAKAFGPDQSFSIGYRVRPGGASTRGGIRYIRDLDVYEYSPVLHGANRLATLQSVKSAGGALGGYEYKSTTTAARAVARRGQVHRHLLRCALCGNPQLTVLGTRTIPESTVLLCPGCITAAEEAADGRITPEELAEAEELTSEEEYAAALDGEESWALLPDGTLVDAEEDERSPRAWRGDRQRW